MGTLALSLTGVSTNWLVPQILLQIAFAQGTLTGNPGQKKVLIMGPKTSSGSATADTMVYGPLSVESDVIATFGARSPVHMAWRAFTKTCKTAAVYGIAVTESAGVAATDTITFTTNATGTGTAVYTVGGQEVSVSFQSGDAFDTSIAEAMTDAINALAYAPVSATRSGGVITVAYPVKGTNGNWVRHRGSITSGVGTTMAVAHSTLQSGATDESYTTALATVLSQQYDIIIPCVNPTAGSDTRLSALITQVLLQAYATSGILQQVISGCADTLSNATTLVTAYNKARLQIAHQKNSELQPFEIAAHLAALRYNTESSDPGANYDGYGLQANDVWLVPAPYATSDWPSAIDVNTALSVGLTPIAVNPAGKSYLVMSCTAAGADPRIRDTCKVTVADSFGQDLVAKQGSQWARAKLADDEPAGARPYPTKVLTPTRLKELTIVPLLRSYAELGRLTEVDGDAGSIACVATGIDPTVVTRINAQIPIKVMPLCHQAQFLVNEVSSG